MGLPDIDIDFADRNEVLEHFKHVPAKLKNRKHNTGVYFHRVPSNPFTNVCTVDHVDADDVGFFKLDLLNLSIYKDVDNDQHLTQLMEKEPLWELLEHRDFVDQLFHLNGHSELLKRLKPQSVEQLAATLAIIRPAKRHLQDKGWQKIMEQVWIKPVNDNKAYYFKKAHALSYAMVVVVHMNLICEQLGFN
jgi:DNA polymerase III alpha subunit